MKSTLLILLLMLSTVNTMAADQPPETLWIFVLQTNRQRDTLERDAVLMVNTINAAQPGDHLQAITVDGSEIFSWEIEKVPQGSLEMARAKVRAINGVKQFFLRLFDHSANDAKNDVAGAIAIALDRFNNAAVYKRLVLVLLNSGLQHDQSLNFARSYPSDSFIVHELSPFSSIRTNTTQVMLNVIMVPQRSDYVNSYHQRKIEQWYQLLFQHRKAALIGFTTDHQSATRLVLHGGSPMPKNMTVIDYNEPLTLIEVSGLRSVEE